MFFLRGCACVIRNVSGLHRVFFPKMKRIHPQHLTLFFFLSFLLQKQMTPNEVRWQMTPNEVRWKSDFVENSLNIRWALTDHKPPSDAPPAFYRDFSAKGPWISHLEDHPSWDSTPIEIRHGVWPFGRGPTTRSLRDLYISHGYQPLTKWAMKKKSLVVFRVYRGLLILPRYVGIIFFPL